MTAGAAADPSSRARKSRMRIVLSRLLRKKSSAFGLVTVVVFALVAVFAPLLAPYGLLDMGSAFVPPGQEYWLGTDSLGADVLTSTIHGARTSLIVGLGAVLIATVIGMAVGAAAGYFGDLADNLLMRVTEGFLVLPQFFLAIIIIALFGPSLFNLILVIGILNWPVTARLLRAEFLSLKKREFVEAGRALGMSDVDLIFREILPNALPPIIVNASLQVSGAILIEASLSFLGLGDPNVTSWGTMLHNAQQYFNRAWWMAAFPGLALFTMTLGLNLLGDGLNDALDPRHDAR